MNGRMIADFGEFWGRSPRIYEHMSEGYGTGEFYIDHLSYESLQKIADWMITLPADLYEPLQKVHRHIEWTLINRYAPRR